MTTPAHVVNGYALTDVKVRDSLACLGYHTGGFMPGHDVGIGDQSEDNSIAFRGGGTILHVQVTAAQAGRS
jgi:hypothetical protein